MDIFMEYIVKKKKSTKDIALIALAAFAATILSIAVILGGLLIGIPKEGATQAQSVGSMFSGFSLLIVAAIWYGVYWVVNYRNVEFEYILTNSEIDIDKIIAKKRRKRLLSFDFKEAEILANIKDGDHNYEYKNQSKQVKLFDCTGNPDNGNIYFSDFSKDGEKSRLLFQPTSKMLDSIAKLCPRKVFIHNDFDTE